MLNKAPYRDEKAPYRDVAGGGGGGRGLSPTRPPTFPMVLSAAKAAVDLGLPREIPHLGDAAEATALLHAEAKAAAETQRDLYNMLEFKRERLREVTLGLGLPRQLEEATAAAEVAAEMERVLCDTLEYTISRLRAVMDENQRLQTRDQES